MGIIKKFKNRKKDKEKAQRNDLRRVELETKIKVEMAKNKIDRKVSRFTKEENQFIQIAKRANEIGDQEGYQAARSGWKVAYKNRVLAQKTIVKLEIARQLSDTTELAREFMADMGHVINHLNLVTDFIVDKNSPNAYETQLDSLETAEEKLSTQVQRLDKQIRETELPDFADNKSLDEKFAALLENQAEEVDEETISSEEPNLEDEIDETEALAHERLKSLKDN